MTGVVRMRLAMLAVACAMACAEVPSAVAETLFSDDFQDGESDGWRALGEGDVRLTTYAGNVSLRLSRRAEALVAVSAEGYADITVSLAFAADGLGRRESCVAEISWDDGVSWREVYRIGHAEADAVTLHRGSAQVDEAADAARLVLRVRVEGNRDDDICWADDIRIDATPVDAGASAFDAVGTRVRLTAAMLRGDAAITGPSPMDAFGPAQNAGAPTHQFEGRLVLDVEAARGGFEVAVDRFAFMADTDEAGAVTMPPPLDMAFVQAGDRLIPAMRGPIASVHPDWEWVLGTGRVWTEPGDDGMTRAAVPFAWMERNANCMHNGMATFLYDDTSVSDVAYQISSQTCLYFQFETWGLAQANYVSGPVSAGDDLRAADAALRARRLPVRPIAELAADMDGGPAQFGSPDEVSPHNMTAFGYVTDGVHYVGGCATGRGVYPACDELILPSYSLAKTMVAGLALMRLEHVSSGARYALITDYVPACAAEIGRAHV